MGFPPHGESSVILTWKEDDSKQILFPQQSAALLFANGNRAELGWRLIAVKEITGFGTEKS